VSRKPQYFSSLGVRSYTSTVYLTPSGDSQVMGLGLGLLRSSLRLESYLTLSVEGFSSPRRSRSLARAVLRAAVKAGSTSLVSTST
jgi:hypothetical protein